MQRVATIEPSPKTYVYSRGKTLGGTTIRWLMESIQHANGINMKATTIKRKKYVDLKTFSIVTSYLEQSAWHCGLLKGFSPI